MKKLKFLIITILSAILSLEPLSVFAIDEATLNFYNQNGIYYYDPTGNPNCFSGNGNITIMGTTAEEMMWSGLVSAGFTETQAAAIMGNIASEGIGNPAQHEGALYNRYWSTNAPDATYVDGHFDLGANTGISYGLGLVQWSFGRRVTLYNKIKEADPELLQYFNNPTTYSMKNGNIYALGGDGFIEVAGIDAAKALMSHEIALIWEEMNESYTGIFEYGDSDLYGATWWVLAKYEIPAGDLSYGAAKHQGRYEHAQAYYDKFAGNYTFSSGSATEDGSNVTIIGDSITDGSRSAILELLPNADIHAQHSKFFDNDTEGNESGLTILNNLGDNLRGTVVFALGTNDGTVDQATIQQVVDKVGSSRNLIFVTAYSSQDPNKYTALNTALKAVADANSNVSIADWASAASADPATYINQTDGYYVHASDPAGTKLFAETINQAVNKNAGDNVCGPGSDFSSYVLAYAWPEYHQAQFLERMPDYAAIVSERISAGLYVGGSVRGVAGIDCGGWVTTLVQESGWDTGYNYDGKGGATGTQEQWARENWTRLNPDGVIDTSILQPGDVAFTDGHTWIYVGEIPGFDSNIASASYSTTGEGGRSPMAGHENPETSDGAPVRWYRK